jgi:hypothetical protein
VLLGLAFFLGMGGSLGAQQLLADRGQRAADLWCFPLASNPQEYVYLPSAARLATDDEGNPQFSFIRYVINAPGEAGDSTITEAGGGAVLHFLVLYETPEQQVRDAEALLRSRLQDDEITVRGPMVFQDGRYTLVSSILRENEGERQILATGRAPVLEGNRLALSFDLDPQSSKLLLESFQMATPDVSLVFDMTFAGLADAYEATLTVDWSEVKKSETFSAGGSVYFVSADVEVGFDELLRENAIRLESAGSDAKMEALLTQVYDKLLELMFRPVLPEQVPEGQGGGLMEALSALVGSGGARNTTGFGAHVGYQLKELRSEGLSVLDFNHQAAVERHGFITFNIGDLYSRYGEDPGYFRTVNLGDAAFQQREVHVSVDGALLPEFERYINNVTVTLRKQHASGAETVREMVLDKEAVESAAGDLRMIYGWDGDDDRLAWLEYDYRTRWSFQGGGSYDTDWQSEDAAMIDLFAPYERRDVDVIGDADNLLQSGVRAVVVRLEYPFFSETRSERVVMRPEKGEEEKQLEITLPLGQYAYDYEITWMLSDGSRSTSSGSDDTGVVFVDEMPE